MKPETLNANVEGSAALLELTKAQFTAAALKQPPLFCQKPETLNANVERSAALLELTKAQFTALALKQPQLFYQKPETLNAKKPYIMKIATALGETKDFAALIENNPSALTNSKDYLDARYPCQTRDQYPCQTRDQARHFRVTPETPVRESHSADNRALHRANREHRTGKAGGRGRESATMTGKNQRFHKSLNPGNHADLSGAANSSGLPEDFEKQVI
jgi:hypothetical protein